jgi:starch synthase (maltosyl-transferring)
MDSVEKNATPVATARPGPQAVPSRIALVPAQDARQTGAWPKLASNGFDHVLVPDLLQEAGAAGVVASRQAADAAVAGLVAAVGAGVALIDLALDCVAAAGDVARDHPELFTGPDRGQLLDPRQVPTPHLARPSLQRADAAARLGEWWGRMIAGWAQAGLGGVRLRGLAGLPHGTVPPLLRALRQHAEGALVVADTATVAWDDIAGLSGIGLDGVLSSLAWWNWRDGWFEDELAMLRQVAPVIAMLDAGLPGALLDGEAALGRALALCVGSGLGWIAAPGELAAVAARAAGRLGGFGPSHRLSAPDAPVQVLLRGDAPDPRWSRRAAILLINARTDHPAVIDPVLFLPATGGSFHGFSAVDDGPEAGTRLVPGIALILAAGAWRLFEADAIASPKPTPIEPRSAVRAAGWPRLAIEDVTPCVDGGLFAVKRTAGDRVEVEADVIGDGHDMLSAALQWREPGDGPWQEARMRLLGNDRWTAGFPLMLRGLHHYRVEAWRDHYATFRHELGAKSAADVPIALELIEGQDLLRAAVAREAPGASALAAFLARIAQADEAGQRAALLSPELALLMDAADDRPHSVVSAALPVDAERTGAGFASWYEVFPRSMSDDPHRHGNFRDVERHLPRIQAMGFDVLYFPPVHPIGRVNRKGPNNTLTPGPEDVGSPYAVGNEQGGHDALHPELGTLDDFLHLVAAAAEHGLEIALDFAIQCAPDHPWLKQHRDWFAWRPDGSIRYAENPPKKYQDIVNVDFYADGAVPELWLALANVVMFWAEQGVRLFRVDNPHTKPFPFWQWLIAEVRARYPDAVFLAEAFTRPKVMNRLGKVGFGQSYTYFTWRNSKVELTEYLTQLSQEAPRDFFRPHFFVNTPDINPVFLQTSGRPGFLIRAALAATLSGLWGVYNGFELCEGAALPGREEYLDSEKYQIRTWDWQRPGNIVAEVTQLNRIRAQNPALRSHLDVAFLPAGNDAVLFYERATADRSSCLLCMVSLDPHHVQATSIELPLWKWGLPDQAALQLEDLLGGDRFQLAGKYHNVTLTPQQPYLIWRATPLS